MTLFPATDIKLFNHLKFNIMKTKRFVFNLAIIAGLLFSFQACTNTSKQNQESEEKSVVEMTQEINAMANVNKAICVLHPTEGNDVTGTVTFTRDGENVKIVANLEGLTPGKHGFHIHQLGDCSAPDGTSAGGHYNPENVEHGGSNDATRHVGDLGNIEAGEDGTAHLEMTDSMVKLNGAHSVIGRAIIVHAGEDDLTSQPTGAAGARVACGVIGIDE
jgi:Cu-Zn family superoxide dismutase